MSNKFYDLLKLLQRHYWKLHQVIIYKDCQGSVPSSDLARCGVTKTILKNIIFDLKYIKQVNCNESPDVKVYEFSIDGKDFGDHTFLIIYYNNNYYLLQSFYYEYLFSGKYGLQILNQEEFESQYDGQV